MSGQRPLEGTVFGLAAGHGADGRLVLRDPEHLRDDLAFLHAVHGLGK
jgi:hypothetical protein